MRHGSRRGWFVGGATQRGSGLRRVADSGILRLGPPWDPRRTGRRRQRLVEDHCGGCAGECPHHMVMSFLSLPDKSTRDRTGEARGEGWSFTRPILTFLSLHEGIISAQVERLTKNGQALQGERRKPRCLRCADPVIADDRRFFLGNSLSSTLPRALPRPNRPSSSMTEVLSASGGRRRRRETPDAS